jgi:hypothetical protein
MDLLENAWVWKIKSARMSSARQAARTENSVLAYLEVSNSGLATEWLQLMLYIPEVQGSNRRPETGYSD